MVLGRRDLARIEWGSGFRGVRTELAPHPGCLWFFGGATGGVRSFLARPPATSFEAFGFDVGADAGEGEKARRRFLVLGSWFLVASACFGAWEGDPSTGSGRSAGSGPA